MSVQALLAGSASTANDFIASKMERYPAIGVELVRQHADTQTRQQVVNMQKGSWTESQGASGCLVYQCSDRCSRRRHPRFLAGLAVGSVAASWEQQNSKLISGTVSLFPAWSFLLLPQSLIRYSILPVHIHHKSRCAVATLAAVVLSKLLLNWMETRD